MKLGFDGEIKLEFHGAKVTSDSGLFAYRDLDNAQRLLVFVNSHKFDMGNPPLKYAQYLILY